MLVLDCEVYSNYFLLMFKDIETGKYAAFEMYEQKELNIKRVKELMSTATTISFNGNSYDLIIISAALAGAAPVKLKEISDAIIKSNLPAWKVAQSFRVRIPHWDHVDVIEVAPGKASLKIYGGRLGAQKMQDLPIAPDDLISPAQRLELEVYCRNDLDTTEQLYRELEPAIKLRSEIGAQYGGIDLRSKSDAQIAEAVIKHELEELTGKSYRPRKVEIGHVCRYVDPKIVSFETPALQDIYARILKTGFPVGSNGAVQMPDWLKKTKIVIGTAEYQMGVGGLHSCEKSQSVVAGEGHVLMDLDVDSYYPSIILKLKLSPESMGDDFLRVYQSIVTRRLQAKKTGNKLEADTLKICVNGSFGKLGSMYSALYAPELLIQTTITGQLCLLMLIERLHKAGMRIVSANTDGIVVLTYKLSENTIDEITFDWMLETSFSLSRADYHSIHSRDVNSYIAVKLDGKTKRKGAFSEPTLAKNPEFTVVTDAAADYLSKGASIIETIRACRDIRKFVTVRRVDGGAQWRDNYLGKAVRFYYSTGVSVDENICYAKNRNKVPRSDGAMPLMTLPDTFPDDVDITRYVNMAQEALKDMGVVNA